MMQLTKPHITTVNDMVSAINIGGSEYLFSLKPHDCDDNDTKVCRGIISILLDENK